MTLSTTINITCLSISKTLSTMWWLRRKPITLWELTHQNTRLFIMKRLSMAERFMLALSLPTTIACSAATWMAFLNSAMATLVATEKLMNTDSLRKLTIPKSL